MFYQIIYCLSYCDKLYSNYKNERQILYWIMKSDPSGLRIICAQTALLFQLLLRTDPAIDPHNSGAIAGASQSLQRPAHHQAAEELRNHSVTTGPVHSSTRKRIYADSMINGINVVFSSALVANKIQA